MNATPTPPARPRRWLRRVLIATTVCAVAALVVTLNAVTLTRDARALSAVLSSSIKADPAVRVQGSVGPIFCTLLRTGLRWVDGVPPEARQALAALRAASVAVYHYDEDLEPAAEGGILDQAERAMRSRGWSRTVAVRDGADHVVVYTAPSGWGSGSLRVCVAVRSRREIVVVEAKLAVRELQQLVRLYAPELELPIREARARDSAERV